MSIPVQLIFSDGQTNTLHLSSGERILDAARTRGLSLLVDCEEGNCGTCQAQVSCGAVDMDDYHPGVLSDSEKEGGTVLICRARALEPAVIELPYSGDDALAASEPGYLARVEGIEPAATDTLALQLSTTNDVPFLPGQYVNIAPTAEFQRSYSMANPPGGRYLKFFIALHPGGRFSEWLQSAAVGDRVELSAPRGTFYLRSNAKPKVMVAGGTGLAPLLSMLEEIARTENRELRSVPIALLVGARHENQLFELSRLEELREQLPGLSIQVACEMVGTGSPYRRGRVTELLEDLAVGLSHSIYACGPPPMIETVKRILKNKRISALQLYVEKFTG